MPSWAVQQRQWGCLLTLPRRPIRQCDWPHDVGLLRNLQRVGGAGVHDGIHLRDRHTVSHWAVQPKWFHWQLHPMPRWYLRQRHRTGSGDVQWDVCAVNGDVLPRRRNVSKWHTV